MEPPNKGHLGGKDLCPYLGLSYRRRACEYCRKRSRSFDVISVLVPPLIELSPLVVLDIGGCPYLGGYTLSVLFSIQKMSVSDESFRKVVMMERVLSLKLSEGGDLLLTSRYYYLSLRALNVQMFICL